MSSNYLFSVGTIGLSKRCGRKPSTLLQAARHNRREIQAELGANGRIDASRMVLNETLAGPDSSADVVALARSLMAAAGVDAGKLRKDHVQAIEILFSLPADTAIVDGLYFRRCAEWAGEHFGVVNILSADIHRDESTPHCHVLVLPMVGGRMRGGDLIDHAGLRKLRESFYRDVAKNFGLKKPIGRMFGAARGEAVKAVLDALESAQDAILASCLWVTVKRDIERDPAPFVAALGIEVQALARKPKRTMAEIFTSPGKGPKTEWHLKATAFDEAEQKPIAFEKDRKLSSVAVAFHQTAPVLSRPIAPSEPAPDDVNVMPVTQDNTQAPTSRAIVARQVMPTGATRHERSKEPATEATIHDSYDYIRVRDPDFDIASWQNDFEQFSPLHH